MKRLSILGLLLNSMLYLGCHINKNPSNNNDDKQDTSSNFFKKLSSSEDGTLNIMALPQFLWVSC